MTNVPYETEETDADKVADRYVLRLMCLMKPDDEHHLSF